MQTRTLGNSGLEVAALGYECYGPFVNEELVGEALAPVRDVVWTAPGVKHWHWA